MRGSVHGYVVSADNEPVENAIITLLGGRGPVQELAPHTDSAGSFAVDGLAEGRWVVSAASSQGPKATATVYVFDNAVSDVTIQIPGLSRPQKPVIYTPPKTRPYSDRPRRSTWGEVRGRVLRENEQPVSGAKIDIVRGPADGSAIEPMIHTDADGWFSHTLSEGDWVLSATTATGRGEAAVSVFADATSEMTIYLSEKAQPPRPQSKQGLVRGFVLRADTGEPIPDATIGINSGPGPAPDIAPITDSAGRFVLSLDEGEWTISATTSAGNGTATVSVGAGKTSEVTIRVSGSVRPPRRGSGGSSTSRRDRSMPGSVQGLVIRADTGVPVMDATIVVVRGPGPAPDIAPVTDRAGRFFLDPLPEGQWVFRAITPDNEIGEATVRVAAGSTAQFTIEISQ